MKKTLMVLALFLATAAEARIVYVAPGAVEYDPALNSGMRTDNTVTLGKNGESWESAFPDLPTAMKYAKGRGTLYCVKVGDYKFTDKIDWPSTGDVYNGDGIACGVLGGFTGETKKDANGKPILPGPMAEDGRRTRFIFAPTVEEPVVRYALNSWWASFANIDTNLELPVVWISPCMDVMRERFPAKLTGAVNDGKLICEVGDELAFTFTVDWFVKNGRLKLTRIGDDGVFDERLCRTDEGPIVYRTKAGAAGSVMVFAALLGEDGNEIGAKGVGHPTLRCDLGVIAAPDRLLPAEGVKPADFAAFWANAIKAVRADTAQERTSVQGVDGAFSYSLPCPGGRPATGYITVPLGAAAKALPAILELGDHNPSARAQLPKVVRRDLIMLIPSLHGQDLDGDETYFKNEKKRLEGYFVNDANAYADRSQMYPIILRLVRAVELLKTVPEWNGTLVVSGFGQGAYLALVLAALEPEAVTRVEANAVWLADLSFTRLGRMGGRIPALTNGSRYFDATLFAPMVKCPVDIRCGALDRFSTPAGQCAVYNLLGGPKRLTLVQGAGHLPELGDGASWSVKSADWKEAE